MPRCPKEKYLIVILGPTAIGKTALSIQLAQYLSTEIISADSRQCYQGMTIGTAQPTLAAMQGVPHHLINFLPIHASYNAERFAQDALKILANLWKKHDHVLMTGGSGLYIQAVCQGLDAIPPISPIIRIDLNKRLQKEGLSALVSTLATQDPDYYQIVDRANPRRVIRALEVCLGTGQPYSKFRKQQPQKRPFKIIKIGLTRERQVIYQRINQRVEQMLEQGLEQEAVALYPYRHYNALQTVGYREIFGHLAGHYGQSEAIRLLKRNTRRYAKRQLTWFSKEADMARFHPDEGSAILQYIQRVSKVPQY